MAHNRRIRVVITLVVAVVAAAAVGFASGARWQHHREAQPNSVSLSAADIRFAQTMSIHHDQAVLLAQTLPRDVDPQVRALADQILLAQSGEIATMHGWLTLFGQPFTPATPAGTMPSMPGMAGAKEMPGMASVAEITRLSHSTGRDAETLFLQLMIRHHRGGIDMSQAAYNGPLLEPIRRIALEMVQDQGNEIGVMTTMLTSRGASPLPYP